MTEQRIGIIDIGSNSIRLVVYEQTESGAHRVIDGSKHPARLSDQIDERGRIGDKTVTELINILNHFRLLCVNHKVGRIRTVATAAVRNAANGKEVIAKLNAETGLGIEILSGEREAKFGFLGMINSMDVSDGFLIDIGGGSTEVSLFRDRTLVKSVSFPFGCVSLTKRFAPKGMLDEIALKELEDLVEIAAAREPWLRSAPGLPMVGVGGTIRAAGKIHQAVRKYPFPQTHNYAMEEAGIDRLFDTLRKLPMEKRRKFPGLSKDRVDLIVPGIAILRVLFRFTGASGYLVCGAGLRDGLFFQASFPQRPRLDNIIGYSVNNLYALYPEAPLPHVNQVNRLALQLLDELGGKWQAPERARTMLDASSILYRIGASIDYNQYAQHTFYLITHSYLNGMTHREIMMTAAIASFKTRSRTRRQLEPYEDLLSEEDMETVYRLGSLLLLAAALDRGQTQSISRIVSFVKEGALVLKPLRSAGPLVLEKAEVESIAKEFRKCWGLQPELLDPSYP
ncbi:Ppx/GppA family phosphatase [Paenibacillus beijingensis]|uniref:Phosphatase n=1 Tax=Paenibacillus beijingensis TaxID=1126833 RepID=A0A0D5NLW2_9BACL|nr:Ppx/GppA family phosphatase [Paenibacillus beijingensis]AJY75997.1 phosphatase [Paenibacillus beijingensis]